MKSSPTSSSSSSTSSNSRHSQRQNDTVIAPLTEWSLRQHDKIEGDAPTTISPSDAHFPQACTNNGIFHGGNSLLYNYDELSDMLDSDCTLPVEERSFEDYKSIMGKFSNEPTLVAEIGIALLKHYPQPTYRKVLNQAFHNFPAGA